MIASPMVKVKFSETLPPPFPDCSQAVTVIGKLPACVGIPVMLSTLSPTAFVCVIPLGMAPVICQLPGVLGAPVTW